MSWLDTPKSEHVIRQEHFVAGWESGEEAERKRIIELLKLDLAEATDRKIAEAWLWGFAAALARVEGEQYE